MSPERIRAEDYGYGSDVWSLGLSIFTVAMGKFPIDFKSGGKTQTNTSRKSGSSEYWELLNIFKNEEVPPLPPKVVIESTENDVTTNEIHEFSFEFQSFVAKCLTMDQRLRPTALQLLNHPWLNKFEATLIDLDEPNLLPPDIIAMKREKLSLVLNTLRENGTSELNNQRLIAALAKSLFLPIELVKNEIHRVLGE